MTKSTDLIDGFVDDGFVILGGPEVSFETDQQEIVRLADHPYFVGTLFVPQTSSAPGAPHPLVTGLLAAARPSG